MLLYLAFISQQFEFPSEALAFLLPRLFFPRTNPAEQLLLRRPFKNWKRTFHLHNLKTTQDETPFVMMHVRFHAMHVCLHCACMRLYMCWKQSTFVTEDLDIWGKRKGRQDKWNLLWYIQETPSWINKGITSSESSYHPTRFTTYESRGLAISS